MYSTYICPLLYFGSANFSCTVITNVLGSTYDCLFKTKALQDKVVRANVILSLGIIVFRFSELWVGVGNRDQLIAGGQYCQTKIINTQPLLQAQACYEYMTPSLIYLQ